MFAIAVAAGDGDGDGHLDIVVAAAGQPQLLRNDGTGQFVAATSLLPSDPRRSFALALVDVDQDLDLDLFLGSPDEPVRLWRNAVTVPRLLSQWHPTPLRWAPRSP